MKITRGRCGAGVVLSVTILLGLTGCGSGSSTTSAGADASAAAATSGAATPTAEASTSAAEDSGGDAGGDYCAVVKENVAYLTGGEIGKLVTSGKKADWEKYFDITAKANDTLVAASPDEIRPVVEQLTKDSQVLRGVIQKADYDIAKAGTSEVLASINTPEHLAAVDQFVAFTKSECDIDLLKLS
ncbi:hypothetical protein [Kineosporia sp. A_224]|uniref:hypothetical protein n=1 Tax=Kineosporia sp. A_224 TaxID=1962180 RepID=UPI000B4B0AFD|nr:hypothetical protein [Kineosporia sp. A_224]